MAKIRIAKCSRWVAHTVTLGPTDTRDEASRLARAWMESRRHGEKPPTVENVDIDGDE